mmetsp:Transcript_32738/g.48503  ORF Transcript_32738/g.48503 Transcript_32738/m.48503 type:complete len:190 (-) Transcript_32738:299-868(-)|eukprot:CAMPEP_0194027058 /NCGR_PEP_ID=MMETSP0009_2-20130614/1287_1 /TAXON_ID=210454 /ORGANISM="Grammatophora oceanica, Strain CCMP 410" /LENGTH=189 /DNA_ID=CAMNT_0038666003 /DNA_START=119 /DNA_END=688 /DNA_ORIENTATION=+
MNNSPSPTSTITTTTNRSELLPHEISSEVNRRQEEEENRSVGRDATTTPHQQQASTTSSTSRQRQEQYDPVTRNLLLQAIRAIMQAAATIFGLGVGVGLILGDSLRSRPLVVTNPNISLVEQQQQHPEEEDDNENNRRSPELTPQGEISARPPPTEPLPSCCGRSMYRARSNVQEAPPSLSTAALLPSQ